MNTRQSQITGIGQWSLLSRGLLFALIWALLTDGASASWWIGVPAILLALFVSLYLMPPVRFSSLAFFRFIPFFIVHSVFGGVDVARRVFHPGLPIDPARLEYALSLPPGAARVFIASVVNLLPGTLSIEFEADVLVLHVLDGKRSSLEELQAVERLIAEIFVIQLPSSTQEP